MSLLEKLLKALPPVNEERNGSGLRSNYAVGFNDCLVQTKAAIVSVMKPCAARIGPHDCQQPRMEGKLFCQKHLHASNRIYLPITHIPEDTLCQKAFWNGHLK